MIIKKIAVIGPESTGKSTLSEALAMVLHTVWVPEYARGYIEQLQRPYTEEDLLVMAEGQLRSEDELAAKADKILVCDTDLYVIKVWSEHKYGRCHPWILAQIAERKYDLYVLTYIDTAWEQDPQREHPDAAMREYFYNIYKDIVVESGVPFIEAKGEHNERLRASLQAVTRL